MLQEKGATNKEDELSDLQAITDDLYKNQRNVSKNTDVNRRTVVRINKKNFLRPYHIQLHHYLTKQHFEKCFQFCNWIRHIFYL